MIYDQLKPLKLSKSVFTCDIKKAKLLNTHLPPVYLSEVAAAGYDPQYLLNLNQEAYTLAHSTTAHSSSLEVALAFSRSRQDILQFLAIIDTLPWQQSALITTGVTLATWGRSEMTWLVMILLATV